MNMGTVPYLRNISYTSVTDLLNPDPDPDS